MNIHPVFVHFPIAFLSFYSIMEILRTPKLQGTVWDHVKATFLILGSIFSILAYVTGEWAEGVAGGSQLIETHSMLASVTVWFFAVLSVLYLVRLVSTTPSLQGIRDWLWSAKYLSFAWRALAKVSRVILDQGWLMIIVGIVGFGLIMVTGALGGAAAYGPDADPFVSFIYHLFF